VVPGLAGYEGLGQATVLTAAPLLMGVPLGLIGGAVVFRAFADSIGALPEPTLPILALVAIALGLIAVANVAAVLPARRARRLSTAELLRAD
jgi:ABC-type antimicrobial peptide transport system permease subunit